jgi:hypothetical protein
MRIVWVLLALCPIFAGCSAARYGSSAMMTTVPVRTIEIELLALDLESCGRCTGTDQNLEAAIQTVAAVFREAGAAVQVTRHVVTTAEEAQRLRFIASPTIRVDGRDIAFELRESNCGDCGDLCGCEGGVDCRVWVWQGQEHVEAPKALIVDALLRAYAAGPASGAAEPYVLPENLRTYFAGVAAKAAAAQGKAAAAECCDRTACCEPSAKAECCGSAAGSGAAGSEACGCR